MTGDDALRILLIEDNLGDARLIEEMLREAEEHAQHADESSIIGVPQLIHETRLAAGLQRIDTQPIDVILLDLGLPDSTGSETLEAVLERTEAIPIVVLTGHQDREFGIEAVQQGAQEYLIKGDVTSDSLIRSIRHSIERNKQARQIERQRDELETVNQINALIQEIIQQLIEASTREDIERTVCERLAASAFYQHAWIGEREMTGSGITFRVSADIDEPAIWRTVDSDASNIEDRPDMMAIRTGEIQVMRNIQNIPAIPESMKTKLLDRGIRSGIAIPLTYGATVYGMLGVTAVRHDAFSEREQAAFAALGETVGFAIYAVNNEKLLFADSRIELEFRMTDAHAFSNVVSAQLDCKCSFDSVISATDGSWLHYMTVENVPPEQVLETAANAQQVEDCRLISEGTTDCVLEVTMSNSPIRTLMDAGASGQTTVADHGETQVTAEVPLDADIQAIADAFRRQYPDAQLIAKREVERPVQTTTEFRRALDSNLTERQRTTLQAAYFAGYFDWPRGSTAEELATTMDIASATLHKHLRKAQKKLLTTFFDDQP